MRKASFAGQFKKDLKLARKRNNNLERLQQVLDVLLEGNTLPESHHDHALTGNWKHRRECHVEPDWLLIYRLFDHGTCIRFERLGTHSDLFR